MFAPLIIFIVSGLGIISIVGIKSYQWLTHSELPFLAVRAATEKKARRVEQSFRQAIKRTHHFVLDAQIVKALYTGFSNSLTRFKNAFTLPGHWLDRRTRNLVSLVRGRQPLDDRGLPSSNLRNLRRPS